MACYYGNIYYRSAQERMVDVSESLQVVIMKQNWNSKL